MQKLDRQFFEKEIEFLESHGFVYREDLSYYDEYVGITEHVFMNEKCDCIALSGPFEDGNIIGWSLGQVLFNGKMDVHESEEYPAENFHEFLGEIFERFGI